MTVNQYANNRKSKLKFFVVLSAFITLIVPFILILSNSDEQLENEPSFCPLKMVSGFSCMGCGITKSMVFLYLGDFQKSLQYHLLGPLLVLLCLIILACFITDYFCEKDYLLKLVSNKNLWYSLVFLFVIHYFFKFFLIQITQ